MVCPQCGRIILKKEKEQEEKDSLSPVRGSCSPKPEIKIKFAKFVPTRGVILKTFEEALKVVGLSPHGEVILEELQVQDEGSQFVPRTGELFLN